MSHLYVGRGRRHASPPPPSTHVPFIFIRMPTCLAKCQDEEHRSDSDPWGSSAGKQASPQQQQQSKRTTARSTLAREQVSWVGILACHYVVSKGTTSREVPWLTSGPSIHPSIHTYVRTHARTHGSAGGVGNSPSDPSPLPHQGEDHGSASRGSGYVPRTQSQSKPLAPPSNVNSTLSLPAGSARKASCRLCAMERGQSTHRIPSLLLHRTCTMCIL
jgi:hypothetical protein